MRKCTIPGCSKEADLRIYGWDVCKEHYSEILERSLKEVIKDEK